MLATEISVNAKEYAWIYARGTGLNNHNSSIIKLNEFTILNHAYFWGLALAILDRRTLKTVHLDTYDLL